MSSQFIKKGFDGAWCPKRGVDVCKFLQVVLAPEMATRSLDQDVRLLLRRRGLDRRHADTLVAVVEDRVVLAHEHVSEDPHLAKLRRQLDRHEGEEALALHLEHVVLRLEGELLPAAQGQLDRREGTNLR